MYAYTDVAAIRTRIEQCNVPNRYLYKNIRTVYSIGFDSCTFCHRPAPNSHPQNSYEFILFWYLIRQAVKWNGQPVLFFFIAIDYHYYYYYSIYGLYFHYVCSFFLYMYENAVNVILHRWCFILYIWKASNKFLDCLQVSPQACAHTRSQAFVPSPPFAMYIYICMQYLVRTLVLNIIYLY